MLKSSFFRSLSATAALTGPAVQNVLAQQCCCFASKTQPPYLKDATAKAPKPKTKTTKTIKQKRPPSGYTLFIKDRGAGAAGPGMFTRLAQEWKGLSEAQKAPYLSQAAALKAETQQARAKAEAAKGPKKPGNAYNVFYAEQYSAVAKPGGSVTEAAKEIAGLWKALPEAEKERRKAAATQAMEAWKAAHGQQQ